MNLSLRKVGGNPAIILELTVENYGTSITVDVSNLDRMVDTSLIENLRSIADELEEHNLSINELNT
ncbi:MAG: hypothetical protein ABIN04_15280 [Ginsengibacter sp.]